MSPDADMLDLETGRHLDAGAVAALAEATAVKAESARGAIETIDDKLDELRRGETLWQRGVDARLSAQAMALDHIDRSISRIEHAVAVVAANSEMTRREVERLLLHMQTMPPPQCGRDNT